MQVPEVYCAPFHESSNRPHLMLGCEPTALAAAFVVCIILRTRGHFDESLALCKRQEEICLQLGLKRGLGYCHWNWGLLERDLNHPKSEQQKLSSALRIFTELKLPREIDEVEAALAKTTRPREPRPPETPP